MKILNFDSLPSTNDYVKSHASEGDMVVTAKRQTAGRGTKNRRFDSGMGGLYLSKLTHYTDFPAADVFRVMLSSSLAVCRTVEDFGLKAGIKWPNDVFVNGKKICGILIENTFSGGKISSSVVGIGLNINNVLPFELREIATTMSEASGKNHVVEEVRARLLFHLNEEYSIEEYKKYIFFFNQEITLIQGDESRRVTALDIDERGRLVVWDAGELRAVSAGEVSLRF